MTHKFYRTRWLVIPAAALVLVGLYAAYLGLGGTLGREWLKAQIVILRADYEITLTSNGGDCSQIGTWIPATKTCRLTRNLTKGERIRIADDRIRVDGSGYQMRSPHGGGPAVLAVNADQLAIFHLRLTGYSEGILLQRSEQSVLRDLTIDSVRGHAIRLMGNARFNRIIDNDIGPADWHGVALWNSDGNVIAGNRLIGTRDAVRLQSSRGNMITWNRTMGSLIEGVDLHMAEGNTIILNDLFEAIAAPLLDDAPKGSNTYETRWGGNYVLRFDEPTEGCSDANADNFCDSAYDFFGNSMERAVAQPFTAVDAGDTVTERAWRYTMERVADLGEPQVLCSGCHDLEGWSADEVGPPLRDIVGKDVAAHPDFPYSQALRTMGGQWTVDRLDRFLSDPEAFATGTTMIFPGIDDPAVRRDILQFLSGMDRLSPVEPNRTQ